MKITLIFTIILAIILVVILFLMFFLLGRSLKMSNFGDYKLMEVIGKGGMATIYKARNRVLRMIVAVKVMDPVLISDNELTYKFLKEGENLARINTKYPQAPIVKALEYGLNKTRAGSYYFIAMEFLKGKDLLNVIKSEDALNLNAKLYIIKEVAHALAASHALQIYHRDIAPDNIFIDGKNIRLIDFGIAKQEFSDYRTLDGAIAGKPYYMSPEQCAGKAINDRSDIYSLGSVMYYFLEGKPLFAARNPLEIMKMHQMYPVPQLKTPVPESVSNLLYRMLDKNPNSRPDARQVKAQLEAFLKPGSQYR